MANSADPDQNAPVCAGMFVWIFGINVLLRIMILEENLALKVISVIFWYILGIVALVNIC